MNRRWGLRGWATLAAAAVLFIGSAGLMVHTLTDGDTAFWWPIFLVGLFATFILNIVNARARRQN